METRKGVTKMNGEIYNEAEVNELVVQTMLLAEKYGWSPHGFIKLCDDCKNARITQDEFYRIFGAGPDA